MQSNTNVPRRMTQDIVLILVQVLGIAGGVLLPDAAGLLTPFVLYFMMSILLLSFLRIDFGALVTLQVRDVLEVAFWTLIKLGMMPVGFWLLARWVVPSYALPVLLLSGVSTGVVAPFMSNLLGANTPRILQVVVLTSLLVPLSLPGWVKLLMAPRLVDGFNRRQFPIAIGLFLGISLGIFSSYSDFILGHMHEVLISVGLAFLLAFLYMGVGLMTARLASDLAERLTGAVCLTIINNVLIVVFSFQFFDPQAPLLAAMYMLPFFAMIIPLRRLGAA